MQEVINSLAGALIELLVIVLLSVVSALSVKAKAAYDKAKQKDTLGIIDIITDRAVEYAAKELKGAAGTEKRDFALQHATKILAGMGIKVSNEQLLAELENGFNKWKAANPTAPEPIVFAIDGLSDSVEK